MQISEIIKRVEDVRFVGDPRLEILGISDDSRTVEEGWIFVANKGRRALGITFVFDAIKGGAVAVVSDDENVKNYCKNVIICKNTRKTAAEISRLLFGSYIEKLKIVGITGTKGKTTTAFIAASLIGSMGMPTVCIGTLGVTYHGISAPVSTLQNTTPTAPILYKKLADAAKNGATVAVIEVSSQALAEYRVHRIPFDVCVFTGISADHIGEGEHRDLFDYMTSKRRLFLDFQPKTAIANSDDCTWRFITDGAERVIRVGTGESDLKVKILYSQFDFVEFSLSDEIYRLSIGGEYNAINSSLALAVAKEVSDFSYASARECLSNISIAGRYEIYTVSDKTVIIDFAHNAQSFSALISDVRRLASGRIIAVFGSVGERSHLRRRDLARVAEAMADLSVITSDDPGDEPAELICEDILSSFSDKSRAVCVIDRREAILYAIDKAEAGDTVLLLGKGQEQYLKIRGEQVPFSEREILLTIGAVPYRRESGKR